MRLLLLSLLLCCGMLMQAQEINIIPRPASIKYNGSGSYVPRKIIRLYNAFPNGGEKHPINRFLSHFLKTYYGITVQSVPQGEQADIKIYAVRIPNANGPSYQLHVHTNGVNINANFEDGAFHGVQTLLQLLPPDGKTKISIPLVDITDMARFQYRGMHLDVGRHFYPVAFVKRYLDYLAYHKINKFHWHLTEDQGWRIEIKKYPELTRIGSKRNGTIIDRYPGKGNDNKPYGGYYTQEEIREVVQYAKERYIEVIPEIEMPGHSSAAIAAYPWLSCFPDQPTAIPANMISQKSIAEQQQGRIKLVQETWGIFDDVFCAGKESTFEFLQNVIDEVITLFPSKYFHIGGDECPKTHWEKCTLCQQRMKQLNLKDEHELQSYFVQRIEKYLNSKGRTLIGWDEILEGGLAPNAIVMSWRGEKGGIEAAKEKHKVIMTPGKPVYFDHSQSKVEDSVTIGGYNPIEAVYAYNPVPKELTADEAKYVWGAQANVWTEYMNNSSKIEYMIFPRMAALSEVLWTQPEQKEWKDFERRLAVQFRRYDMLGANYSRAYFQPDAKVEAGADGKIHWSISSRLPVNGYGFSFLQPGIPDTLRTVHDDGKVEWVVMNDTYRELQSLDGKPGTIAIMQSGIAGAMIELSVGENKKEFFKLQQPFTLSKSTAKKITLTHQASSSYPGDGPFTLVNGVINEKGMLRSQEFLGFSGNNCEALIDFEKAVPLQQVVVHILDQPSSWIHAPKDIRIFAGDDASNLLPLSPTAVNVNKKDNNPVASIGISFNTINARYLKVVTENAGIIPQGKPGAGNKAWLFVSELEVK